MKYSRQFWAAALILFLAGTIPGFSDDQFILDLSGNNRYEGFSANGVLGYNTTIGSLILQTRVGLSLSKNVNDINPSILLGVKLSEGFAVGASFEGVSNSLKGYESAFHYGVGGYLMAGSDSFKVTASYFHPISKEIEIGNVSLTNRELRETGVWDVTNLTKTYSFLAKELGVDLEYMTGKLTLGAGGNYFWADGKSGHSLTARVAYSLGAVSLNASVTNGSFDFLNLSDLAETSVSVGVGINLNKKSVNANGKVVLPKYFKVNNRQVLYRQESNTTEEQKAGLMSLSVSAPVQGSEWNQYSVPVSFTGNNGAPYEVVAMLNGVSVYTNTLQDSASFTIPLSVSEGNHNIVVSITDTYGQKVEKSTSFTAVEEQFRLSVSVGEGVNGSPVTGGTYKKGSVVNYSYSLQSGYNTLVVKLDGVVISNSGSFIMNNDRSLVVTAIKNGEVNHNPSIDDLTATPNPVSSGDPATISFKLNDVDGDNLTWTASLSNGGGGSLTKTSGSCIAGSSVSLQFTTIGPTNATVTITVSDGKGGSATRSIGIGVQ
jgi:hypothetical protein